MASEPTMTDAEVLAWLREDERDSRMSGEAHVSLLQRRLALARRETAAAVAAERRRTAVVLTETALTEPNIRCMLLLRDLARHIENGGDDDR